MRLPLPTSRHLALRLSLLIAAALGLSGCQSIAGTTPSSSQLRLYDASPDAPGLDFALSNIVLAFNLGFGTQTSYVPVATGNYTLNLLQDGTSQVLATAGLGVQPNKHYTAFAGNVAANLQVMVLTDQNTPAPTNQIDVRLIDQATAIGAVDVYFIPQNGKLISTAATLTNVTFGQATGYIPIPAGTYQIALVPTGTVPIATTVTLVTSAQVTYSTGMVRTFVLLDNKQVSTPSATIDTLNDFDPPG